MKSLSEDFQVDGNEGHSWPYTAVIGYRVGFNRSSHVICAQSLAGLRSAFENVNAGVEGAGGYKEVEVFIEEARVKGPIGEIVELKSFLGYQSGSFFEVNVPAKEVFDAIRFLEMK
jgi:hypothetical protein